MYEHSFVDHSYAVGSGRGPQRALLTYLKWLRRYRWRLSLDVARYFASIDHRILCQLFDHRLGREPRTRALIRAMIAEGGTVNRSPIAIETMGLDSHPVPERCGLPLGGYLSHWSGGLYLDGLDHHVKRVLRVPGYLRYMDDLALFGDNRSQLETAREAIRAWLWHNRKLQLKTRRDGVLPASQPGTFLGYRVSRAGMSPGPKAKRRLKRRLRHAESGAPGAQSPSLSRGHAVAVGHSC